MFTNDEDFNRITLTYNEEVSGVSNSIARTLDDKFTYAEIVEQFVWFLQSIGFTYIGGLTVLDKDGEEIYTTDTI